MAKWRAVISAKTRLLQEHLQGNVSKLVALMRSNHDMNDGVLHLEGPFMGCTNVFQRWVALVALLFKTQKM